MTNECFKVQIADETATVKVIGKNNFVLYSNNAKMCLRKKSKKWEMWGKYNLVFNWEFRLQLLDELVDIVPNTYQEYMIEKHLLGRNDCE